MTSVHDDSSLIQNKMEIIGLMIKGRNTETSHMDRLPSFLSRARHSSIESNIGSPVGMLTTLTNFPLYGTLPLNIHNYGGMG